MEDRARELEKIKLNTIIELLRKLKPVDFKELVTNSLQCVLQATLKDGLCVSDFFLISCAMGGLMRVC